MTCELPQIVNNTKSYIPTVQCGKGKEDIQLT